MDVPTNHRSPVGPAVNAAGVRNRERVVLTLTSRRLQRLAALTFFAGLCWLVLLLSQGQGRLPGRLVDGLAEWSITLTLVLVLVTRGIYLGARSPPRTRRWLQLSHRGAGDAFAVVVIDRGRTGDRRRGGCGGADGLAT